MTRDVLNDFLRRGLQYGDPARKRVFASPSVAAAIRENGEGWCMDAKPGDDADFWLLGAYGFRVPVSVSENVPAGGLFMGDAAA